VLFAPKSKLTFLFHAAYLPIGKFQRRVQKDPYMNTTPARFHYVVCMSDRKNKAHIEADTPEQAATIALGVRLCGKVRLNAIVRGKRFEPIPYGIVDVRAGPTVRGGTPVNEVRVSVTLGVGPGRRPASGVPRA
jgi:hypothetical protein